MLQAAVPAVLTSPQLEGIVLGTAAAPAARPGEHRPFALAVV